MQQTQARLVDVDTAAGYQIGDMEWVVAESTEEELLSPLAPAPMCGPSRRLTSVQIRAAMKARGDELTAASRAKGLEVY